MFWFLGIRGQIGPYGLNGLDGLKGIRGDNGSVNIGEKGAIGKLIYMAQIKYD